MTPVFTRGVADRRPRHLDDRRGVRIGIIYRPVLRPGLVMFAPHRDGSRFRACDDRPRSRLQRSLRSESRFQAADSIRSLRTSSSTRAARHRHTPIRASTAATGGARPGHSTIRLYQAARRPTSHSTSRRRATRPSRRCTTSPRAAIRRAVRVKLPRPGDPDFRQAVHRLRRSDTPGCAGDRRASRRRASLR